ncbi:MAG: hypothetical protein IPM56_16265 [Ignavibacteriales bacterium]|nr:MAG: hypothetical protein IPM56_16265 [Ignavibacteriales bacterium]
MTALFLASGILILTALLIAMLCRSLVHQLWHHYQRTKTKLEKILKRRIDDYWWNPVLSYNNKKTTMVQFSDAFHTFNTIELGCYDFVISLLVTIIIHLVVVLHVWLFIAVLVAVFLFIGILVMPQFFNLGYDKLWR